MCFDMAGFDYVSSALSEVEVAVCVVVGYVLDHLVDEWHFALRKFAVRDVLSEHVAEDSAEIFVARIGNEAA